jgi:hypothetical protein
MKKVTKVEYSCECEDFCVPGRGEKICQDCCREPAYKPASAEVRTKKKLIKHEVITEEPTYKWVVERVCDECAQRCQKNAGKPIAIGPSAAIAADEANVNSRLKPVPQNRSFSWSKTASAKK